MKKTGEITLPIYNAEGKEVDSIKLNAEVFDGVVNTAAIYQAVNAFRANQRKGLAGTKTRGEVSGGGKKPWRQKGTGRARVGSTRSPLWRHGGVIFGPHPRDFSRLLPKKIKRVALKSALCAKLKENNLIVLDELKLPGAKTREAARIFDKLKIAKTGGNLLLLLNKVEPDLARAMRNLGFLSINLAKDTNAYEVLAANKLLINKDGLDELTQRLKE